MNTKELIQQLIEADPSGRLPVCVENRDINFVITEPAYWDGRLEVIHKDKNNRIVGAKVTSKGYKVSLNAMGIEDAIAYDHTLPVDLDELGSEYWSKEWEIRIDEWRKEMIEIEDFVKNGHRVEKKYYKTKFGKYVPCKYEDYIKLKFIKACINLSKIEYNKFKKWKKRRNNRISTQNPDGKAKYNDREPFPCPVFYKRKETRGFSYKFVPEKNEYDKLFFKSWDYEKVKYKDWKYNSLEDMFMKAYIVAKSTVSCKENLRWPNLDFESYPLDNIYNKCLEWRKNNFNYKK